MSAPTELDWQSLKRLGRYLVMYPRCVTLYRWQEPPTTIDAFSDSDWGGDLTTRRSTSGGCIMRGHHMLSHWSRTQQVISLSSAEAELHAEESSLRDRIKAREADAEIAEEAAVAAAWRWRGHSTTGSQVTPLRFRLSLNL